MRLSRRNSTAGGLPVPSPTGSGSIVSSTGR